MGRSSHSPAHQQFPSWELCVGGQTLSFHHPWRPLIMGIVNVTPDSFSDGGQFASSQAAIEHGILLAAQGADILDIGGESTRPGAQRVTPDQESARVLPVIEGLAARVDIPISIDTTKASVAQAALQAGASIVNDVSCLRFEPELAQVVATHRAHLIIMHSRHTPADMQRAPHYEQFWPEVVRELQQGVQVALDAGVPANHIAVDPGIGFGKRQQDNLQILQDLTPLHSMGYPILIGASRKSFLGKITGREVTQRLIPSLAAAAAAIHAGAHLLRVHDVEETKQLVDVFTAIHTR